MKTTPDVLAAAGFTQGGSFGNAAERVTEWFEDGHQSRKVDLFDDGTAFGYVWAEYAEHGAWDRADEEFEDVDVERAISQVRADATARLLGVTDAPQAPAQPTLASMLAALDNDQLLAAFAAALNSRDDVEDAGRSGVNAYVVPTSDGEATLIAFSDHDE